MKEKEKKIQKNKYDIFASTESDVTAMCAKVRERRTYVCAWRAEIARLAVLFPLFVSYLSISVVAPVTSF